MKKLIVLLIVLVLTFSACNDMQTSGSTSSQINNELQTESADQEDALSEKNTQKPEEQPTDSPEPIEESQAMGELPASFSWKKDSIVVTPQDQADLGSCAVFATMSMFETHIAITTGSLVDLSEQHYLIVSPEWSDNTGVSPEDVLDFITEDGVVTEQTLPYKTNEVKEDPVPNEYGFDYKLEVAWGSQELHGNSKEHRIEIVKQNVLEHGPVVTNIALHNDFDYYKNGLYECNESSSVLGGHWLVILGWKDDETVSSGGYWICKNSWGAMWGEGGFCKIAYNDACGIDDYILYYIDTPKEKIKQALDKL